MKACVVATVKRGKEHFAVQKISKTKEVTGVLVTYGLCDVVVRIEVQSLGQLDTTSRTDGRWPRFVKPARSLAPTD